MKVVLLDLFGGSGGVGRCTREILRQLELEGVTTWLCGQSHVVDSFNDCLPTMPRLRLTNLERPKFSLKSLKIRFASRRGGTSASLANNLIAESTKAFRARETTLRPPVLVNYPQVIAPPSRQDGFCIFLHDLNWRRYPGNFSDPDQTDRNCRGWAERSTKVITNSECTRAEVIEYYQCAPSKVVAAPLAPFAENLALDRNASSYLESLGLRAGRFYLFPGVWGLHKGHETLTEAIELAGGADPVVVTCGKPLQGISASTEAVAALRRSLAARWDKLMTEKKLVVVGGVPEHEMQALRAGCRAYVIPSQYEGFGFPLVEAVFHHRPAIVSDIQAHREILNRHAHYKLAALFPPTSSRALAMALKAGPPASTPMSADWQDQILATWSWQHTVRSICSALNSKGTEPS